MIALTRLSPNEPLLKPRPLPWEQQGVLNAGVTIYNGQILLLYRAVGTDHISRFGVAVSSDGINFQSTGDQPVFAPDPANIHEQLGVEDPRITFINGTYAIVYVAASANPVRSQVDRLVWDTRISLAFTQDFKIFDRRGVIIDSYNDKDAALFPVTWNGYYYLYHRRHPSIWLSKSLDFYTWEDVCQQTCMVVEPNARGWDNDRIGIGSQPIYTEAGWLVFYHGRDKQGVYRIGAYLADLINPEIVVAKLPYPLLQPELPFELQGFVPNVVFTCGAVEAGDSYWVYYGGADYALSGATINKAALLDELKRYTFARTALVAPQPGAVVAL